LKKILPLILLLILILPTSAQSQSDTITFQLSDDHEMEAVLSSNLVWEDGSTQTLVLNLTMSDFRVNNSEIIVQVIQIIAFEEGGQGELLVQNTTEQKMKVNSRTVSYNELVNPPLGTDRFYLNVSIFAYPSGGGADEITEQYSFRFPEVDTIIVQRDNLVPLVDLYGLPPPSYFQFWLPIYAVFIFSLLLPSIVYGVYNINERRDRNSVSKVKVIEEGENE